MLLTCGIRVVTARYPAQTLFHARHAVTTCSSFHPSVVSSLQRDVCAPCFAILAAKKSESRRKRFAQGRMASLCQC